jgi:putative heme-binding domain-containing protein
MIKWEESDKIEAFVRKAWDVNNAPLRSAIAQAVTKTRSGLSGMEAAKVAATSIKPADPTVDLAKIASKKGQIGKTSIEDVILSLGKIKGDPKLGMKVFTTQGCIACHTTEKDQAPKGPFMGQVGAILTRDQIAESILKPNASISQGFATVMIQTKSGKAVTGFVTAETADQVEMRDIASQVHIIKTADIKQRTELETSMMPPGLANALSLDEFAALVAYLSSKKG